MSPRRPLPTKAVAAVSAAVVLATSALIAPWEGERTAAYIPVPGDKPTICFGSTAGVKLGDRKTHAECLALLREEAQTYGIGIAYCINWDVNIPSDSLAAFVSLSYNIGTTNFCRSTLVKKLNAGDVRGACDQIPAWDKFHGRPLKGLTNRRAAERARCLKGLS